MHCVRAIHDLRYVYVQAHVERRRGGRGEEPRPTRLVEEPRSRVWSRPISACCPKARQGATTSRPSRVGCRESSKARASAATTIGGISSVATGDAPAPRRQRRARSAARPRPVRRGGEGALGERRTQADRGAPSGARCDDGLLHHVAREGFTLRPAGGAGDPLRRRSGAGRWRGARSSVHAAVSGLRRCGCPAAAEAAACTMLVTRDPSGYRGAVLPVLDPDTAVALLGHRARWGRRDVEAALSANQPLAQVRYP